MQQRTDVENFWNRPEHVVMGQLWGQLSDTFIMFSLLSMIYSRYSVVASPTISNCKSQKD